MPPQLVTFAFVLVLNSLGNDFVDAQAASYFYQNSYVIRLHKIENEWVNRTIFKTYDIKAWNTTDDNIGLNFTVATLMDITARDAPRMLFKSYRGSRNVYKTKLFDINEDFCEMIKNHHYGILPGLYSNDITAGCPLRPAQYGLFNYVLDYHKFPPALPAGDYKVQYTLFLKKEKIRAHAFTAFSSVIYKTKLQ